MTWRWDQGRLGYFQYDVIRKMAPVLVSLEGTQINQSGLDPLRASLSKAIGLPFAPKRYRLWRNYARVFKCELLATNLNNKLTCTKLCKVLANTKKGLTVDEYLSYVIPRFYYPSPAFQDYKSTGKRIFPFSAILKFLVSKSDGVSVPRVSIDEIFTYLIGNKCDGKESLQFFNKLKPVAYIPKGDEARQLREMVIFLSQFDFLKWEKSNLILDIDVGDRDALRQIKNIAKPIEKKRFADASKEILSIGGSRSRDFIQLEIKSRVYNEDDTFTEGKKVRVTHLRTERSRKLREMFFSSKGKPFVCGMCDENLTEKYPWVGNLLEVHHLLPLSSPINVARKGTSIKDLVGLCPTCHRAVHNFYRKWLKDNSQNDFPSYVQANDVYDLAKKSIVAAA